MMFIENIELARIMYSYTFGLTEGAPDVDFEEFHFMFHRMIQEMVEEGHPIRELSGGNPVDITMAVLGTVNGMEMELCHPRTWRPDGWVVSLDLGAGVLCPSYQVNLSNT
ncbi:MAG: hypothetical protein MZU97_03170 [Bacillus subtilis]|nr:hypothetical protein [Bacillus subtilis]